MSDPNTMVPEADLISVPESKDHHGFDDVEATAAQAAVSASRAKAPDPASEPAIDVTTELVTDTASDPAIDAVSTVEPTDTTPESTPLRRRNKRRKTLGVEPVTENITLPPMRGPVLRRSLWREWRGSLITFCFASVYVELCLHLCIYHTVDGRIVYPILFGMIGGLFCSLISSSLPKIPGRILGVILVSAQVIFAEVQLVYYAIFGNFMPISQVKMADGVVTNFGGQILYGIQQNLLPIFLLLVPLIVMILTLALRKAPRRRLRWRQNLASLGLLATIFCVIFGLMYSGRGETFSVYEIFTNINTSTDTSYKNVGMLATTEQELRYMFFGGGLEDTNIITSSLGTSSGAREYSSKTFNVLEDIDFTALAESTDDELLKAMDEYFSTVTPSRKNDYTGLLEDYNLITICAESFCPWFISEELTPTLYKMTHTGIIFENYYGAFQSVTTNGEYTMCMGLYPDMSRTKTNSSFDVAGSNFLPFCLGNALKGEGYQTWAYHNYIGDFYNRNITHTNMGYTFKAADSGLNIQVDWPSSDLEMMQASVDDYIDSEGPFHAYYMTFSGHYQYTWDNAMSAKNRDKVENLPYSEAVKAYIACNLELEYALQYLEQRLEEAGIADKTCIVLTNDHYPYGLTEEEYNELAGQELDTAFEKYRNSFICYVPGLRENIVVDEYCSTADILPTLLNLFGVDYDSRLLMGTDVLSNGIHMAVLSDQSFITDSFRFDASTETLTVTNDNITVSEELLNAYRVYVDNKFRASSNIVNSDYYAHVFGKTSQATTLEDTVVFTDITNIFNQASVLYMYRNGYVDPESEDTFGGKAAAELGEFVDVLYRISERPGTTPDALPEGYEDDEFNSSVYPYYDAVCWAYENGLILPDDRHTDYDDMVDYRTSTLLMLRYAQLVGLDTSVDPTLLQEAIEENPRLSEEVVQAMLWCDQENITTRDCELSELFANYTTRLSRYQMTSFLFYLCTYELKLEE